MSPFSVAARFNGPPNSGNGGYTAGLIATAIGETVAVRLHQPIPLERELTIGERTGDRWEVRAGEELIATARSTTVDVVVPEAPPYSVALDASRQYPGHKFHSLPTCFVCGPARKRHDGLCIFPGPIEGASVFAAPWIPDETLDNGAGKVRPEFLWAALDCPGFFASAYPQQALLGEFAVHVDRLVHVDEACVVVAWAISKDGRKHRAGTALFDEDGERCAVGVATWIELKMQN
jgi:hypothetical protein